MMEIGIDDLIVELGDAFKWADGALFNPLAVDAYLADFEEASNYFGE